MRTRREFLEMAGGSALLMAAAPLVTDAPTTGAPRKVAFCRPQSSADELIAEYEAWQMGNHDGFDVVILDYKEDCHARGKGPNTLTMQTACKNEGGEWVRGEDGKIVQTVDRHADEEWERLYQHIDKQVISDLEAAGRV